MAEHNPPMSELHLRMLHELLREAINEGDVGPFQLPEDDDAAHKVLEALNEWLAEFM